MTILKIESPFFYLVVYNWKWEASKSQTSAKTCRLLKPGGKFRSTNKLHTIRSMQNALIHTQVPKKGNRSARIFPSLNLLRNFFVRHWVKRFNLFRNYFSFSVFISFCHEYSSCPIFYLFSGRLVVMEIFGNIIMGTLAMRALIKLWKTVREIWWWGHIVPPDRICADLCDSF